MDNYVKPDVRVVHLLDNEYFVAYEHNNIVDGFSSDGSSDYAIMHNHMICQKHINCGKTCQTQK